MKIPRLIEKLLILVLIITAPFSTYYLYINYPQFFRMTGGIVFLISWMTGLISVFKGILE